MKWFGRTKKKETIDNEAKHAAKLKKDDETISEKTTTKPSTQKIENTDSVSKKLQLVKEEYNEVVGNLMHAKREQKNMMEKKNMIGKMNFINAFTREVRLLIVAL